MTENREVEPRGERVEVWKRHGLAYRVHIWPSDVWEDLPPERRPASALHQGGLGWIDMRPADHARTDRRLITCYQEEYCCARAGRDHGSGVWPLGVLLRPERER